MWSGMVEDRHRFDTDPETFSQQLLLSIRDSKVCFHPGVSTRSRRSGRGVRIVVVDGEDRVGSALVGRDCIHRSIVENRVIHELNTRLRKRCCPQTSRDPRHKGERERTQTSVRDPCRFILFRSSKSNQIGTDQISSSSSSSRWRWWTLKSTTRTPSIVNTLQNCRPCRQGSRAIACGEPRDQNSVNAGRLDRVCPMSTSLATRSSLESSSSINTR